MEKLFNDIPTEIIRACTQESLVMLKRCCKLFYEKIKIHWQPEKSINYTEELIAVEKRYLDIQYIVESTEQIGFNWNRFLQGACKIGHFGLIKLAESYWAVYTSYCVKDVSMYGIGPMLEHVCREGSRNYYDMTDAYNWATKQEDGELLEYIYAHYNNANAWLACIDIYGTNQEFIEKVIRMFPRDSVISYHEALKKCLLKGDVDGIDYLVSCSKRTMKHTPLITTRNNKVLGEIIKRNGIAKTIDMFKRILGANYVYIAEYVCFEVGFAGLMSDDVQFIDNFIYGALHAYNRILAEEMLLKYPETKERIVLSRALNKKCRDAEFLEYLCDLIQNRDYEECVLMALRADNEFMLDFFISRGANVARAMMINGGNKCAWYAGRNGLYEYEHLSLCTVNDCELLCYILEHHPGSVNINELFIDACEDGSSDVVTHLWLNYRDKLDQVIINTGLYKYINNSNMTLLPSMINEDNAQNLFELLCFQGCRCYLIKWFMEDPGLNVHLNIDMGYLAAKKGGKENIVNRLKAYISPGAEEMKTPMERLIFWEAYIVMD